MIVLGVVLLVLDLLVFHTGVVFWLGLALAVVGLVLNLSGASGHAVGRRWWW